MFDARRFAAVTAGVVVLATVASIGVLATDAPVWVFYVVSAIVTAIGVFQLLMPGRGLRIGGRSLRRGDPGSALTR